LTQLRTGHTPLNWHLHNISHADSPLCPACRNAPKSVVHFLLECPTHQCHRAALARAVLPKPLTLKMLLDTVQAHDTLSRYLHAT
ncbi:hypothetical protein BC628DRAFT_1277336, partial [Trametes gibbosa]